MLVELLESYIGIEFFLVVVVFLFEVEAHGEQCRHLLLGEVLLILEAVVDVFEFALVLDVKLAATLLGAFFHECELDVLCGAYGREVCRLGVFALLVVDGFEVSCELFAV